MLKDKKGMELGLNTIVMAVIALAVLIVVLIVFSGKFGMFGSELNNCVETGKGLCAATSDICTSNYNGRVMDFKCNAKDSANKICCINQCTLGGGKCDPNPTPSEEKKLSLDCGAGKTCYGK